MKNASVKLLFKKLHTNAIIPTKGSPGAAGYDLYSSVNTVVKAKGKQLIETGLAVAIPPGNYGRVAPRSGLTWKHFIDVGAGVIDEDFRGELCVILFNFEENDYHVKIGDRIAQLIIQKITDVEVKVVNDLDETERGMNGLGSTGYSEMTISEDFASRKNEESKENIDMNCLQVDEDAEFV